MVNDDVKSDYAYEYGYRFVPDNVELMNKYKAEGFVLYRDNGDAIYEDGDVIDDSNIDSKYCPFCSGEQINKELLFDFIVDKFKIDIGKEWKLFKQK
ncbi:MAG: hypothetical protein ACYC5G_04670 [Candidatus Doudnabacteria bacterium]